MAQAGLSNLPASGNLALAFQEALTSIVRIKANRQSVSDAQYFRQQFVGALKLANEEGRKRGYSDEALQDARFAVVAFLDETVLNLGSGIFSDWARKPLQEELFRVHMGGEVFFQNLERLMRQPDSAHLADVLEVYLLCLTLGYAGKYGITGGGELMSLKQALLSRIRRIRGKLPELSPRWRPGVEQNLAAAADRWLRPLLYSALGSLVAVVLLFVFYKLSLQSAAHSIAVLAEAGSNR
jgi:type VI secretion system protein ImpK